MRELRILAPNAILGYGYPISSFEAGLRADPHVIGFDSGSMDAGPYYLGEGKSFTTREAVKRDLAPALRAGGERRIPVVIGTAGGAGGRPHVEWCLDIVVEIAREQGLDPRIAVIQAEQEKATILRALRDGRIRPLGPTADLTEPDVARATRIVGQMGIEPFQAALGQHADVVVAGRACDVSIFAALPLMEGYQPGLAMHMAKIIECGAICADPGAGSDGVLATLRDEHFELRPLSPRRRCTRLSVASHSLYEQSHPYLIYEPSGVVDVSTAAYDELADGAVRVSGTTFRPSERATIKLEGVVPVGFRSISIAGIRDPIAIAALDESIAGTREVVSDAFAEVAPGDYQLTFRAYGRDGVMGQREPASTTAHEIGLVIEAVAATPSLAEGICALARATMLHYHYEGRVTTAGSLAFPFSPSDAAWGRVYEFRVHHLWEVEDALAPFPIAWRQVGAAAPMVGR